MNATEKLELQVAESQDGSAIVKMPISSQDLAQEDADDAHDASSSASDDTEGPDSQDDDSNYGPDDDREAIRAARREERKLKKQLHREKARESNHLINALRKQNQDLAQRLAAVETKTSGAEFARLEKAIDDAATRVEYAKLQIKQATTSRNGDDMAKAQQLWYDSQRQLESLQAMKDSATKQLSQPKQNITVPDPMVQKNAANWMGRNRWYDPQLRDPDSKIAQMIDNQLTEEGYDPSLADYWDELDERVQKYLPHRYNSGYSSNTRTPKPRSPVTSSGRESTSARFTEYKLSNDRVKAIKDAGMWDNVEQRNRMIEKYAEFDRQQKRG
jgi:hypothetical protein